MFVADHHQIKQLSATHTFPGVCSSYQWICAMANVVGHVCTCMYTRVQCLIVCTADIEERPVSRGTEVTAYSHGARHGPRQRH